MLHWTRQSDRPGSGLETVTVWGSMLVLALNDHFLKGADVLPGWLTGKLSDFAGLLFFPLLLQAAVELAGFARGSYSGPSNRLLAGLMVLVAVVFTAVQCHEWSANAYRWGLAWLQWIPGHVIGRTDEPLLPVRHYADVSDTIGLVSLWGSYQSGCWEPGSKAQLASSRN